MGREARGEREGDAKRSSSVSEMLSFSEARGAIFCGLRWVGGVAMVLVYNLTRVFWELVYGRRVVDNGELDPSSALLTVCTDVVERGVL